MKSVLLTGARGFLGRHCLQALLARGFMVHAVTTNVSGELCSKIQWHHINLLDPIQVHELFSSIQATYLLHFAWCTEPEKYWTSTDNFRWVQASLALLDEFSRCGGQRVVIAGTCAEYDWRFGYCSEEVTPLSPTTVYGTCKHSLRSLLEAFSAQCGLSSAWGRIFFLYGPHEHKARLVPSVTCSLLQEKQALCTHGAQIRDFLYIKDAADAFVALLDGTVTGAVNIASGRPLRVEDIVFRIGEKLGRNELIQLGAVETDINEPYLILADTTRLRQEVSWVPRYDLDQGLDETISYWRARLRSGQG